MVVNRQGKLFNGELNTRDGRENNIKATLRQWSNAVNSSMVMVIFWPGCLLRKSSWVRFILGFYFVERLLFSTFMWVHYVLISAR